MSDSSLGDSITITNTKKFIILLITFIAILSVYVSFSSTTLTIALGGILFGSILWLILGGWMSLLSVDFLQKIRTEEIQLELDDMEVGEIRSTQLKDGTQIFITLKETDGEYSWEVVRVDESGSVSNRHLVLDTDTEEENGSESQKEMNDERE